MKKKICLLGSTGSIGTQTLQVIDEHPDLFEAYVLTANSRADLLIEQGQEMGRDGHVRVRACRREGQIQVKIAGRAVAGQPFTLQLP